MSRAKIRPKTRVLTGREARRYGEKERRREERMADAERFWQLPPEVRAERVKDAAMMERIQRNGITMDDVHEIEQRASREAYDRGLEYATKTCYAAICLALNELHGFGTKRCKDVLNAVDQKVTMALTSDEVIEEAYRRLGLTLNFKAGPLEERVEEREE